MYPVWDAEWSLGAWSYLWGVQPSSLIEDRLAERIMYFPWLIKSPSFIEAIKKNWTRVRPQLEEIDDTILREIENIKYSQEINYERWEYEGNEPYFRAATWSGEVDYIRAFYRLRLAWMDDYIKGL